MAAQRGEEAATSAAGWYEPGRHWQQPDCAPGAAVLLPGDAGLRGVARPANTDAGHRGAATPANRTSDVSVARQIRARGLAAGWPPADIATAITGACGITRIRAFRLALGVSLPDVVAQVQARYEADGRQVPGFSETLLSAYESGQKRPGTEYLHYLCASYRADPADLGFEARCLCGQSHRSVAGTRAGEVTAAGPDPRPQPEPEPEPEPEPVPDP